MNLQENPAPFVVVHHSVTPTCNTEKKCKSRMKSIQEYHINEANFGDIGYNFLVNILLNLFRAQISVDIYDFILDWR